MLEPIEMTVVSDYGSYVGTVYIHSDDDCYGYCSLHNQSDHPLRDAKMSIRIETTLIERYCEHGVGHPDPDSARFLSKTMPGIGVHGCDGCCSTQQDAV